MENIHVIAEITVSCVLSVINLAPGLKCMVEWKNDYFQGKTNCVKADKSGNVLFNKVTLNTILLCNPSSLGFFRFYCYQEKI